ncbi:unnamed protein product [Arabidopsis thaliana]|uniref:Uncharacterized protein n=1 Tax=Arabidopsis thaliana TaxID=3702 RepID=A0A5S9YDW8_ARATH|nr:unnamed protein product [Arabidopsis thaliana]
MEKKEEDDTPLVGIFCLKTRQDMKRFEETEDCFILDFDPFDSFDVACRDYPHPRHLCLNFPFGSTPNSSHCDLCYCYVCDKPAPCAEWTLSTSHCNAYDSALWNLCRTK